MKILSAKFITSIIDANKLPPGDYPEIAFAGRSNVGKSSLINTLVNRKKLALTSSSPGKTRMINFFNINDRLFLVDLPGYGFAKVSQEERKKWKTLIESYVTTSKHLKGVIQLIDSRLGPTELDLEMLRWLVQLKKAVLIVATKADKIPRSKLKPALAAYAKTMNDIGKFDLVPFSNVTKSGKKEIWQAIDHLIYTN